MAQVIVCGPSGCGKTLHREALRQLFGCTHVADDWRPLHGLKPDTLHLTQVYPADVLPYDRDGLLVLDFTDAMHRLDATIAKAVL